MKCPASVVFPQGRVSNVEAGYAQSQLHSLLRLYRSDEVAGWAAYA